MGLSFHDRWHFYNVLSPEFNPSNQTEGKILTSIDPNRINNCRYSFPTTSVAYFQPQTKSSGLTKISSFLKKNRTPKVIVRLPERLTDAKFVESIELELSGLGWEVIDHNMASGIKSAADIKKRTGADLILDISWLKFSDPDMFSSIDIASTTIAPFDAEVTIRDSYYKFKKEKDFEKWKKSKDPKLWRLTSNDEHFSRANLTLYKDFIIRNIADYERFTTNKNVVSAVFKLIDSANGSILGYFHVGEIANYKIVGGNTVYDNHYYNNMKNHYGYFSKISEFYNEHNPLIKDGLLLSFLSYLDVFLPNGEIPFAAQLNEMEDVKLSDETVKESHSSTSTTSGSYSGRSRDYYNSYFNSRYYSGSGRGYSSGNSSSKTNTSGSSTTQFKEAEYIRYSDFFGYYKPLTEKFVQEISKLMEK